LKVSDRRQGKAKGPAEAKSREKESKAAINNSAVGQRPSPRRPALLQLTETGNQHEIAFEIFWKLKKRF
jgi:hypothetical protein